MKTPRTFLWILACLALIGIVSALAFSHIPTTIHARIAEDGGFAPDYIKARVGIPLHLRLISDDVEHGFAIGQNPMKPVLLKPNKPVDVTLTFDKPGTYTFYSTTPSSLNFWRMRGTIEVIGDALTPTVEPPLYVQLGLGLDDQHKSDNKNFKLMRQPSAARGAVLSSQIDTSYLTLDYYVSHSPMETFEELRGKSTLSDEDVWDMVAYIWQSNATNESLANGGQLYAQNCAACHGETGAGNGQFADEMKSLAAQNANEHGIEAPTNFTQPEHLLESKPAIVQGLILRGGMGTGMPMWGSIFTDKQTWDLVAYLYSFQFGYQSQGATQ